MKHYILTRFNLGLYSDNPYKISDPDVWMKHRIGLFHQFTLPSILNQDCHKFTWIMAFDENTPKRYMDNLGLPNNCVICKEQPDRWLRKQPPLSDWVITSRFDNDDIYLPGFVRNIQKCFKEKQKIIDIDYECWNYKTGKYYSSGRTKPNSPFLSLIEPWVDLCTALGHPHTEMPEYFSAIKLGIYAIQVIHDMNVCNKIQGVEL